MQYLNAKDESFSFSFHSYKQSCLAHSLYFMAIPFSTPIYNHFPQSEGIKLLINAKFVLYALEKTLKLPSSNPFMVLNINFRDTASIDFLEH